MSVRGGREREMKDSYSRLLWTLKDERGREREEETIDCCVHCLVGNVSLPLSLKPLQSLYV